MKTRVMSAAVVVVVGVVGVVGVSASAQVVGFEDVINDATPFSSGGMDFVGDGPNQVVPNGVGGAGSGSAMLAWCGSVCGPGGTPQIMNMTSTAGDRFDVLSIDAGNFQPRIHPQLGFRDGMTLELVGHLSGGGTVSQSLTIIEDTMTTFALAGFADLVGLDMWAPSTPDGNPDPVIDNIVYRVVPAPGPLALVAVGLLGSRRRRR